MRAVEPKLFNDHFQNFKRYNMTYTVGKSYRIAGMEMFFYYWIGDTPVFEYFIEGKQYLFMDSTRK